MTAKMRILIADDEVEMGEIFKSLLLYKYPACEIEVVAGGFRAVDAFMNTAFDILVMDLGMPAKDGNIAALEIHEMCKRNGLKIPFTIFYTGGDVPPEVEALLADKARFALLTKPVICDQIIRVIGRLHEK